MARNTPIPTTKHFNAGRGKKPNIGPRRPDPARKGAAHSAAVRLPQIPGPQEVLRALIESRRQLGSAQCQIKILAERNARLEQDLAELSQKEVQARHLAYHDGLTGLPNRSLLQDRFNQTLSQAKRDQKPMALLLIDLDDFKRVNSTWGHATGDGLLRAVAKRLTADMRGADTVCRLGGDEFVIMLPEIRNSRMAAAVATKVGARLRERYIVDGYEIHITASVGLALYPADAKTYSEMVRHADAAMYRSKAAGGNAAVAAAPNKTAAVVEMLNLAVPHAGTAP